MENFIKKHRRLSATIFIFVVIMLIATAYMVSSNTKTVTPTDPNQQTGDSDTSSAIQYSNSLFTITQDPSNLQNIAITAYAGYRNAAVNKLYDFGLNPTDYKITFNYESPFKNYE